MSGNNIDKFNDLDNTIGTINLILKIYKCVNKKIITDETRIICTNSLINGYIDTHPYAMKWDESNNTENFFEYMNLKVGENIFNSRFFDSTERSNDDLDKRSTTCVASTIDNTNNKKLDKFSILKDTKDIIEMMYEVRKLKIEKMTTEASVIKITNSFIDGYIDSHLDVMTWDESDNKECFRDWIQVKVGERQWCGEREMWPDDLATNDMFNYLFDSGTETLAEELVVDDEESVSYLGVGGKKEEGLVVKEDEVRMEEVINLKDDNENAQDTVTFHGSVNGSGKCFGGTNRKKKGIPKSVNAYHGNDTGSALTVVPRIVSKNSAETYSNVGKHYREIIRFTNDNDDLDNAAKVFNSHYKCKNNATNTLNRGAVNGRNRKKKGAVARVFRCQCQIDGLSNGTVHAKDVIHLQFSYVANDNIGLVDNKYVIRVNAHDDKMAFVFDHFRPILSETNSITSGKKNEK